MSAPCLERFLLPAAWVTFFVGLAGVMLDTTVGLPVIPAWLPYALAVAGAVMIPVGHVARAPRPPGFIRPLGDPWERDEQGRTGGLRD